MATITGFTAERTQAIEDQAIVGAAVVGNNLILTRNNGQQINAGNVRGLPGIQGVPGNVSTAQLNEAITEAIDSAGRGILAGIALGTDHTLAGFSENTWHDVPGASITLTPVVGRWYEFSAQVAATTEEANTTFDLQIVRVGGGHVVGQTVLARIVDRAVILNTSGAIEVPGTWAGSQTFKLQLRDSTEFTTYIRGTVYNTRFSIKDIGTD